MTDNTLAGLVGNLVGDPELMYSKAGKPWCKFRISVQPYVPGATEKPAPVFYDVVAFGSLAENACESCGKGDRVVVTGKLEAETWVGRDGKQRTSQKVVADGVGPDLRFAAVTVIRTRRSGPQDPSTAVDEPVGTHPVQQAGWDEGEPF